MPAGISPGSSSGPSPGGPRPSCCHRAPLRRKKKALALSTEVERRGLPCRVTTLERTLVDVLDRPALAGGLEEVWRSPANVPLVDLDVVVDYVRLFAQATLAAKVGFFLEQHQQSLGVPRDALERLRRLRPKQPHYLDRRLGGKLAPGWNLLVPTPALTGEWGRVA
jgi:predicted transcriptional regulator of viral defense system